MLRDDGRLTPTLADRRAVQALLQARCRHPTADPVRLPDRVFDQPFAQVFAERLPVMAERLAVATDAVQWTYADLDTLAQAFAARLLATAGPQGRRIGLLLPNGPAMIAALLGTLMAGHVFVPLNPAYPKARLRLIAGDAAVAQVYTTPALQPLAEALAPAGATVVVAGEDPKEAPVPMPGPGPGPWGTQPDTPCYLLYTSGSTGTPKGVVGTHRALVHDAVNWIHGTGLSAEDRLLLPTAYTQLGVQLFGAALLSGASLHPVDIKQTSPRDLVSWMQAARITVLRTTATYFRTLTAAMPPGTPLPDVRLVRLGGEPVLRRDWVAYRDGFSPRCLFFNALATTENGAITSYLLDHHTVFDGDRVPAGFVVPGSQVHIVDETGAALPAGEVGEIVVQSAFHAAGYWQRPEETQARFRPADDSPGEVCYHTGDVGRLEADGCLVHLGRKDFQIKIRGFRIEPAEVEQALIGLPGIEAAVVSGWTDAPGETRLVAYLVGASQHRLPPSVLRTRLAGVLPEHMVPATFMYLDSLPLTPNGKTDRKALPAPSRRRPALAAPYVPPETDLEAELAAIWAAALRVAPVGRHDRFLDLGGNSLVAIQVVAQILERHHIALPLRALFDAPTIAEMAAQLQPDLGAMLPALDLAETNLTRQQIRLWMGQQRYPENPFLVITTAMDLAGPLDPDRFRAAHDGLGAALPVLRSRIEEEAGVPKRTPVEAPPTLQVLRQAAFAQAGLSLDAWLAAYARQPMTLKARLFEAVLLEAKPDHWCYACRFHQLIADAEAVATWHRLLFARYADTGPSAAALAAAARLDDVVSQARRQAEGPAAAKHAAFWQARLADLDPAGPFGRPLAHRRPSSQHRLQAHLGAERTVRLLHTAADLNPAVKVGDLPVLSVLLVALGLTVYEQTGADTLAIGVTFHERSVRAFRSVIGRLMRVLPIRLHLAPGDSFEALLAACGRALFEALAHSTAEPGTPCYDVVLNYAPTRFPDHMGAHPAAFWRVPSDEGLAACTLHLSDYRGRGVLEQRWAFDPTCVSPAQASAWPLRFCHWVDRILEAPQDRPDVQPIPAQPALSRAPRTDLQRTLAALWQAVLGCRTVGIHDDFKALGGTPVASVEVARRAAHVGLDLAPGACLEQGTLARLAAAYAAARPVWYSLLALQPAGARPPLFCVPPHGGSMVQFADLARHLGPDQPFYGLEALGLDGATLPQRRVEEMAAHYLRELRAVQPEGPYYLGGKCFGGVVAYEMAQQLVAQEEQVALLALFDVIRPPHVEQPLGPRPPGWNHLWSRVRYYGQRGVLPAIIWKRIQHYGRATRRAWQYRRADEDGRRVLDVTGAHAAARYQYVAAPYPGRAVLLRVGPAAPIPTYQRTWAALCQGGLDVHVVPGTHVTMLRDPHAAGMAERLAPYLGSPTARKPD